MYGAIFGDIIGSRFEFDRGGKTKKFQLFTEDDNFTDDTAMTVAVGAGLIAAGPDADTDTIKKAVIESMQAWGHKYPGAGYGGRFYGWLFNGKNPAPYGSYGNGSAMRVSAAGWLYNSLERTREVARATACVTHNHPEGIKGAECTAAVMFLARNGATKDEIREYVTKEFGYDLSKSVDELRPLHEHVESCQDSLPKALMSFFEGNSYDDVVRNAVSLGGDTDTLAAIAGAMAEAMYGIPEEIMTAGEAYIPEDMKEVLRTFDKILGRGYSENDLLENNKYITQAVDMFLENPGAEKAALLLDVLYKRVMEHGQVIAPMVDKNNALEDFNLDNIGPDGTFTLGKDMRLVIDKVTDGEGNVWVPLYTSEAEIDKGTTPNIRINMDILAILDEAANYSESKGLVINPLGDKHVSVPKEFIKNLLKECQ